MPKANSIHAFGTFGVGLNTIKNIKIWPVIKYKKIGFFKLKYYIQNSDNGHQNRRLK